MTRRDTFSVPLALRIGADSLPTVPFGDHQISRLIVGGNPVSGTSHWSPQLSREMVDYFTTENTKRMLTRCEHHGINTWQSRGDRHILRLLHEYRQEGGHIQWIAQTATEIDYGRNIGEIAGEKPIGIYHHGSRTDRFWADGRIDQLSDALKAIRQTGVRTGLGTHLPEVIDYVEDKGWDVDFYMTCLYNPRHQPGGGELFDDNDREKMLKRVRQTSRQCLLFKVYGAKRHCDSAERMLAALKLAFASAKPHDAVVVGMFPKHSDQVAQNCELVRRAIAAS